MAVGAGVTPKKNKPKNKPPKTSPQTKPPNQAQKKIDRVREVVYHHNDS